MSGYLAKTLGRNKALYLRWRKVPVATEATQSDCGLLEADGCDSSAARGCRLT